MTARLRGWILQRWHRARKPYEVDRGEFGKRGWMDRLEPRLVNTSLSFKELNTARRAYSDLPSQEDLAAQFEGMSDKERETLTDQWRSDNREIQKSFNEFRIAGGRLT